MKLMLDIGIHGVVDGELSRIRQDFIAELRRRGIGDERRRGDRVLAVALAALRHGRHAVGDEHDELAGRLLDAGEALHEAVFSDPPPGGNGLQPARCGSGCQCCKYGTISGKCTERGGRLP